MPRASEYPSTESVPPPSHVVRVDTEKQRFLLRGLLMLTLIGRQSQPWGKGAVARSHVALRVPCPHSAEPGTQQDRHESPVNVDLDPP